MDENGMVGILIRWCIRMWAVVVDMDRVGDMV